MLPQTEIDIIATQILVDARSAMESLKQFNAQVTDTAARVDTLKGIISSVGNQMGGDLGKAQQAVSKFANSLTGIKSAEIKQAGMELRGIGDAGESAFGRVFNSINAVRIALGAIVSMILFNLIQGVIQFATTAVKSFSDVEEAIWRIHNAEIALSNQGKDITFKGIVEGIQQIKDELKIFSEPDLLKGASDLATSLAQFGFTQDQILSLTKAAAVLNVVSTESETYADTINRIQTSLLTGNTKGISQYNIQLDNQAIKLKAVDMGLLKASDSVDKLTAAEKAAVKVKIIEDSSNTALKTYNDYLGTNSAKLKENAAAWEDVKAAAGGLLATVIPSVNGILAVVTDMTNKFKVGIALFVGFGDAVIVSVAAIVNSIVHGANALDVFLQYIRNIATFKDKFKQGFVFEIKTLFAEAPSNAPDWLKKILDKGETPTAQIDVGVQVDQAALDDLAKLDEDLQKVANDAAIAKRELEITTQQKYRDIEIQVQLKIEDIQTQVQQKIEDAQTQLQQKIYDIQISTQQKMADAQTQYRLDQLQAEQEFLLKMKQLHDQFLMDLDDALHARDARQVLSLIKQYNFNKEQAIAQKNLDDKLRKEKLAADLAAIQLEMQRQIQAAQTAYQRQLEEIDVWKKRQLDEVNTWEQRQIEDLNRWHQDQLDSIARNEADKVQALKDGYDKQYGVHQQYQQAIQDMIRKYFSEDANLMYSLLAMAQSVAVQLQGLFTNLQFGNPGNIAGLTGMAEGGSIIATKPTAAIFGERGPEVATFTPLGRNGRDVNKVFGNVSPNNAMNGKLAIEMLLSPDLEARIVDNTLSKTADVITRVSRTK